MKLTNRTDFNEKPFDVVVVVRAYSNERSGDELRFVAYNAVDSVLRGVDCNYVLNIEDAMSYIDFNNTEGDTKRQVAIIKVSHDDIGLWSDGSRGFSDKVAGVVGQHDDTGVKNIEVMVQSDNSPNPNDFWNKNPY